MGIKAVALLAANPVQSLALHRVPQQLLQE